MLTIDEPYTESADEEKQARKDDNVLHSGDRGNKRDCAVPGKRFRPIASDGEDNGGNDSDNSDEIKEAEDVATSNGDGFNNNSSDGTLMYGY